MPTTNIATKEVTATEFLRQSLIDYYLDNNQFDEIKKLLSEDWEEFAFSQPTTLTIEELSNDEKRYAIEYYAYNNNLDEENGIFKILLSNLDKVFFAKEKAKNVFCMFGLTIKALEEKIEKGEDIYLLLDCK